MGQVCAKHNQFYETACRWCEKPHPMAAGPKSWFYMGAYLPGYTPKRGEPHIHTDNCRVCNGGPDLSESTLDRHGGCE